jgi:hypothetical protein
LRTVGTNQQPDDSPSFVDAAAQEIADMHRPEPRVLAVLACQAGIRCAGFGRPLLSGCLLLVAAVGTSLAQDVPTGLEAAPADTTLRVGEVHLLMHDIFTEAEVEEASGLNRTLRTTMNTLHVNTRPWVVRQELLFDTGDPFDPAKLEESERNLRSLGILNAIEVAPVDTTEDGEVPVHVITRETWTLGLNLSFALASSGNLRWNLSLTEKNFLGYGTLLRGAVGQDLDASFGRIYVRQNRLLRSPVTVEFNYDDRSDGHDRWAGVTVPFRADDQAWAMQAVGWQRRYETRWYLSNAGPAGEDPTEGSSLHALLPVESDGFQLELDRRISRAGEGRVWRLGLALHVDDRTWDLGSGFQELSDGRVVDLSFLAEPGQPLDRDTGTSVWPHLVLSTRGRNWITERYLQRYGNQEDVPLDVQAEFRAGPEGPAVGATAGYGERWQLRLAASNWERLGRAYILQSFYGQFHVGNEADQRHYADLLLGSYLRLGEEERPFTLRTFVEGVHASEARGDQVAILGLDRGLRTLDVDGMAGEQLLRWSAEIGRVLDWEPLGLVRTGWGVYYTGGIARWPDEERDLGDARHELGVGLRLGGVRSGTSDLARVDLSYDLTGVEGFVITTVSRGNF